jgi:hypothetical protein
MGWACGTYGGEERLYSVLVGKREGKRPFGNVGVDGSMMLTWSLKKQFVGVELIDWTQDRNLWRAVFNAVMNHRVL